MDVTLETERLVLRMWREDDYETYARMCADPEVMRYIGGQITDRTEAWRHMAAIVGHWQLKGYGHWAIEEKASGKLAGRVGFLYPPGWPDFEIGWILGKEFWGKGYATEGARKALDYAFSELGRKHVISLIHPENHASIKVAQRLGEELEGKAVIFGNEVLVYGVDRTASVSGK